MKHKKIEYGDLRQYKNDMRDFKTPYSQYTKTDLYLMMVHYNRLNNRAIHMLEERYGTTI